MYLDGLSAEEDIPFRIEGGSEADQAAGGDGPQYREAAAGAGVIDLEAMKRELEANPAARVRR